MFFVDTSALAKRYVIEAGSPYVRAWFKTGASHSIVISSITTVEMVSMLMQKQRQNIISATQFVRARNNFLKHVAESYITIDVNENLLRDARGLVTRYPLRTLDALQLASALETIRITRASVIFVSADNRLLSAAVAEGLTVDNPINYP